MSQFFIPVLLGTTRPKRESIKPAKFVMSELQKNSDIRTQLVDPNEYHFPFDGNDPENTDPNYEKLTSEADGFIIVSPEYNHGIPSSLKRMLDSEMSYANYIHKPVAFVGVSSGPWGGVRMIESLALVARELGLVACSTDLQFPFVQNLFNEDGSIKDPETYQRRLGKLVTELLWLTKVLKAGRENRV